MKSVYEHALGIMAQGDETLAEKIKEFMESLPKSFKSKLDRYLSDGAVEKEKVRYEFHDGGDEISITIGSAVNANKDYLNLSLAKVTVPDLMCWPRFDGERQIGSFSVFMYADSNPRTKPVRVTYEYTVKRVDKKVLLSISTPKFLSFKEENKALLEKYGLTEAHEHAKGRAFEIDTQSILNKNIR